MKKVKNHNGFIYPIKYKSSKATFDSSKWTLLAAITASKILGILSTKDWR